MNFEQAVDHLYNMKRAGVNKEKFESVLASLGNPQNKFKGVNVAGTNGKGSACAMIHSVMRKKGLTDLCFMTHEKHEKMYNKQGTVFLVLKWIAKWEKNYYQHTN